MFYFSTTILVRDSAQHSCYIIWQGKSTFQSKCDLPFPWLVKTNYARTWLKLTLRNTPNIKLSTCKRVHKQTRKTGPTCIQIPTEKLNLIYKENSDHFRELKHNISTYNHVNSKLNMLVYKCDLVRHLGFLSNQPNWYAVFSSLLSAYNALQV